MRLGSRHYLALLYVLLVSVADASINRDVYIHLQINDFAADNSESPVGSALMGNLVGRAQK